MPQANPPATTIPKQPVSQEASRAAPGRGSQEGSAEEQIELDKVNLMLRDYRTLMGENPVGTNVEIMKAIMGGNPRQARLGPPEGQMVNADGELLDRWGTPLFFHQLSGDQMEIQSAGPDRVRGTRDDVIWK